MSRPRLALRTPLAVLVALTALAALAALVGLAAAPPARAVIDGTLLVPATPRVSELPPIAPRTPIRLADGIRDWHGALSHIAGSAHYDRGEWIYEDYPYTAYGAAPPGVAQAYEGLGSLATALPPSQRLSGGSEEAVATVGAGPFVPDADLWQLRLAVRGPDLYVLARTTTMRSPVPTALLLLFDTGRGGGASRSVPFGSGLQTRAAAAALVTAAGTRIVDLVSGATTDEPAAADPAGYVNSLETRLPLALVQARGRDELRLVAATGLVTPGSYTLVSGGEEGPIDKVVPRFREPVQSVAEREQALALANHDIDQFFTTVSLARMRLGDRERLLPGIGYTVRTVISPARISEEGGTDAVVRDYGLYVPKGFTGGPTPATVVLRGSGMTGHSLAAITPALFQQLGDDNHAILISPGARSGGDLFEGAAYLDVEQEIADAERLEPIDRNRLTVAGYSMGGFGTYMLAETQPDRFAGAFVIEGPVGGDEPASWGTIVDAFPDVVPGLSNLFLTPIEIYQGTNDADVPVSNGVAAAERLRALGYRYQLNLFPGDHFTPGVLNDYAIGTDYLKGLVRESNPAEVRFTRNMAFEHAIDIGVGSDQPLAGHSVGLRFDHAWWVSDLQPTNLHTGVATIDAVTFARPGPATSPVHTNGSGPADIGGEPASVVDEQHWQTVGRAPARRNAFTVRLTGVASVELDLRRMGLTVKRALLATITSDARATVILRLARGACLAWSTAATRHATARHIRELRLAVTPGRTQVRIHAVRCGR